jgi:peptide subunit release factor 1 (eRF1)
MCSAPCESRRTWRKKLIQKYFDEISHDTGKYCFGVDDTIRGLEMGAGAAIPIAASFLLLLAAGGGACA